MNCPECNTRNQGNRRSCQSCGFEFESMELETPKPKKFNYSEMLKTRFVLWGTAALGFMIGSSMFEGIVGGIVFGIIGFGCGYYILSKRKRK